MPVNVVVGDMFESTAQTLVNTVNTVGVMGKGVALEFRKRFPDMYEDYAARCERGEVRLGEPYLWRSLWPPFILNFPTKGHWRAMSRLDDITRGLDFLADHIEEWGITSLAVPPLGCGHGQLEWRVVGPTLYRKLAELPIPVELYAPFDTPHGELEPSFLGGDHGAQFAPPSHIDPAWAALVEVLARLEREPFRHPVGRISFQKIAYFATEAGIPTGLSYSRGSYGPYSPKLKPILSRLANNGLIREEPLGRMLAVRVGETFDSATPAFAAAMTQWEDQINRVVDLFARIGTQDAEIAATAHFAWREFATTGRRPSEREVLASVMAWKARRKPPLSEPAVAEAVRNLSMLGWIDVSASDDLPVNENDLVGAI